MWRGGIGGHSNRKMRNHGAGGGRGGMRGFPWGQGRKGGNAMVLLGTSASGANGPGYGKLLAFAENGELLGPFSEDARIIDPRGVGVGGAMLFLNSGSQRDLGR